MKSPEFKLAPFVFAAAMVAGCNDLKPNEEAAFDKEIAEVRAWMADTKRSFDRAIEIAGKNPRDQNVYANSRWEMEIRVYDHDPIQGGSVDVTCPNGPYEYCQATERPHDFSQPARTTQFSAREIRLRSESYPFDLENVKHVGISDDPDHQRSMDPSNALHSLKIVGDECKVPTLKGVSSKKRFAECKAVFDDAIKLREDLRQRIGEIVKRKYSD